MKLNSVRQVFLFIFLSTTLFLPCIGLGQDQEGFSGFVKHLPKSNTQVFAVNNVAGHFEAMVANEAIWRALESNFPMGIQPGSNPREDIQDWLVENREFFPKTVAVSSSEEFYSQLVNVFEFFLRTHIVAQTTYSDDYDEAEKRMAEDEVAAIFAKARIPNATIWVDWESTETTELLFEMLLQQASVVEMVSDLNYSETEESFQISGFVGDLIPSDSVSFWLDSMGFDNDQDRLSESLIDVEIFVKVELEENGIKVSIGDAVKDRQRAESKDFPGLRNGDNEIMYSTWNGKVLLESAEQLKDSIEKWEKTGLGQQFLETDVEDIWGSFRTMLSQLSTVSKNGKLRVHRENYHILASFVEEGMPNVGDLSGASVLSWIPKDSESFAFSADRSLGSFVNGWLQQYEDRIANKALQSEMRGDQSEAEFLYALSYEYYDNFGPMRRLIRDELAEIEATPMGVVIDTSGKVTLRLEALREGILNFEELTFNDENFLRMVSVSETEQPMELADKMKEGYRDLVQGILSTARIDLEETPDLTSSLDLGGGVTATEFTLDWLQDANLFAVELDGDFRPHVFVKDKMVVFSTSVDLSQKVLSNTKPMEARSQEGKKLVNFGRLSGETFANGVRTIGRGAMIAIEGNEDDPAANMVFDGMADVIRVMKQMSWETHQLESQRQTDYSIQLLD